MGLIDTHAHAYLSEFASERAALLERAREVGVDRILLPAIDSETHASMMEMEGQFPGTCQSMMGLHPCSVKENYQAELSIVENLLQQRKFIAVGEIGLDFYWDTTYKKQQYHAFHQQVEWALQFGIPIAIHSRNATDECLEVIEQYVSRGLRGVFHCFSGTAAQAERAVAAGFYLGIGGVLTFKNSGLDAAIRDIDVSRLVLETDAPYLAPVPYRGKRNEPAYIPYILGKLAELKGETEERMGEITTVNAQNLFGL